MIAHLDPLVLTRLLALIDGASLRLLIAIAAAGGEMKAPKAMAKAAKISASECAAAIATIGTIKAISVTGSGANARVRIIYPGLLVLHPSTAETRVARGGTPRAAAEAVQPGDRVSVVAVSDDGFSSIVAEGARVLKTASSGGFGASDAAVTLAVDEASALRLASASARGTLTLIIRPPNGSVS